MLMVLKVNLVLWYVLLFKQIMTAVLVIYSIDMPTSLCLTCLYSLPNQGLPGAQGPQGLSGQPGNPVGN